MKILPRIALGLATSLALLTASPAMAQEDPAPRPAPRPTHGVPAPAGGPVPAIECPDCGDGNPCTVDSCDTTTGLCRHEGGSCDDGDPCTTDTCERYDPPFGCLHRPRAAGSICSAAGGCMQAGVCLDGACRATPEVEGTACDAPSDCTEGDACDGAGQCRPGRPLGPGTACDDGDACSSGEVCGFDDAGMAICRGASRSCDDGNPCTIDACGVGEECLHTPVSCNDGNPCTADACDTGTGACTHLPAGDGSSCSGPDRCTASICGAGNCLPAGAPGQICGDRGCERGICNPISPILCSYQPDDSRCQQNGPCDRYFCDPITHQCRGGGACHFGPCDIGQCDSRGFCVILGNTPGRSCNDGNACTNDDVCHSNGFCSGAAASCDDGNPCTADSCDPSTGCLHLPGGPGTCDDGNPCTADGCSGDGVTCEHAPIDGGTCDDGNQCTSDTVCVAGTCGGGSTVSCSDGNACTTDSCNPSTGCAHAPAVCPDDGNACTSEVCQAAGGCVSIPFSGGACEGDGNPCTVDVCLAGRCEHRPSNEGNNCARFDCTVGSCRSGACVLSETCDDGNPCTDDVCVGINLCEYRANLDASCDDANPCTADDACVLMPNGYPRCGGTIAPQPQTCGIGACARTVDTCAGGIPAACVPGAPQPEVCNGIDDDCDGQVDENGIMATCTLRPLILYDPSMRTDVSVVCRFRDRCAGNALLPPSGVGPEAVYIARADRTADQGDNVVAPDPLSIACPNPQQGSAFERGLVETTAARVVGGATVTFAFTTPHDEVCATLDGDRTALLERLASTPDGLITVCVAGLYGGSPWQGCGFAFLRHRAASLD